MEDDDRISQLPQHILHHHILSLLPQNDAVRTCILSKSWRYLGSTRPKFEFDIRFFYGKKGKKQEFVSVLENTLQRYVDKKFSIREFVLVISGSDSAESVSLLNKWIPIVIMNMGVKKFNLSSFRFPLPSVVFQAEFLTELYLEYCELGQINCIVKLHVLKRLSLEYVSIVEETFEKIMSGCPLIEYLALVAVKVHKAHNLNHFFPRLKSVFLQDVFLPKETESLNNFSSNNCPCLEELEIQNFYGFNEFKLSNRSIKRLIISMQGRSIKAALDTTNLLYFEYESSTLFPPSISFSTTSTLFPPSISFSTTSRELKSHIHMAYFPDPNEDHFSTWLLELHEFLKKLSQSQVSLYFHFYPLTNQGAFDGGSCSCEPVVVDHLFLKAHYSSSGLGVLFNCLFRICRPRYIGVLPFPYNLHKRHERRLAETIRETLITKRKKRQCDFWQPDLEKASIQVSDENTNEWHPVKVCALSNNQIIRFMLKWRDLS